MDQTTQIDLHAETNDILINPRLPTETIADLVALSEEFSVLKSHVWLATSGTTASPKLVALSKEAIMVSAKSVNALLSASAADRWLIALPLFHIGGLSIAARAFLCNAACYTHNSWNPILFCESCDNNEITLSSLVPTQLYDLLSLDLKSPKSLRAVIVGGGKLSPRLYAKARMLGWPILPSFGSTEAASQIATAHIESLQQRQYPPLHLLPHLLAAVTDDQRLKLKGESLFTGYASYEDNKPVFYDPKHEGVFTTEDIVSLGQDAAGITLTPQGRINDTVKVSGELISLRALNDELEEVLLAHEAPHQAVVVCISDPRLENRIALVGSCPPEKLFIIRDQLAEKVLPVARPREIYHLPELPRSQLGKPLLAAIHEKIKKGAIRIYPS